jgi:hypothetical protein
MQAALVAVIAVLGTLGGALVSGLLQHNNAIRAENAAKSERLRQERLEACIGFGQSIAGYRGEQNRRGNVIERFGRDSEESKEADVEVLRTRVAARTALLRVQLLIEDVELIRLAREAMTVTIGMNESKDRNDRLKRSGCSRDAVDAFITAAGRSGQVR